MAGYLFNYEEKIWGGETLRLSPTHFRASRLFYALEVIKNIRGKILDVGCGAGDFAEAINFYRPDLEVYGIDISKKTIGIAKKRIKKTKFQVADAQKLPFNNSFFDAVLCFDLIEHVEYPLKTLSEINRVLKKDGVFHTFIPTEGNIFSFEGLLIKLGWKAKEIYGAHPHHFSPEEVRKMLRKSRFKIVKVTWGDHMFQQMVEIGYFSFLSLRGKNLGHSVEGYLSFAKPNAGIKALKIFKNVIAIISYIETRIFSWLPALGMHITCVKNENQ